MNAPDAFALIVSSDDRILGVTVAPTKRQITAHLTAYVAMLRGRGLACRGSVRNGKVVVSSDEMTVTCSISRARTIPRGVFTTEMI